MIRLCTSALLSFFALMLLGCEGPNTSFDAFPIQSSYNLERELGPRLHLVSEQDTLQLRVQYDPSSGRNIFTQARTSDTLVSAWALRHRQLYYLVQPHQDGSYWIHAVRVSGNQVQGLGSGWKQMLDLSAAVEQGSFPDLVRYRSLLTDSSRLRFDAEQLHNFYAAELDSFPVYRVAAASLSPASEAPALYPNPAQHAATLRFEEAGQRTVQVLSLSGQCLFRTETTAPTLTLPVAQLPVGQYVVRASGLAGQAAISIRLLVSR